MKDSGIKWIGEIPEEWEVRKIKNLSTEKHSLLIDGDWIESNVIENSGIPYFTTGNVGDGIFKDKGYNYISEETFNKLNCTEAKKGDILFSRLNLPIGRACIIPENFKRCVVAVDNVIFRPDSKYNSKYIVYVAMCNGYQEENALIARGTTMQRISRTLLQNVQMPIPSLNEQQRIASFLDTKCGEIDELIGIQEKFIEELKSYKQSVITEAVTKGLNPNATLKDSGVEWIGEIPEEWEVIKVRYLGSLQNGISKGGDYFGEGNPFMPYGDVYQNMFLPEHLSGLAKSSLQDQELYSVKKGDVFFTRTSETIEEIGFSAACLKTIDKAVFSGFLIRFRPTTQKLDALFSGYYFRSNIHRQYFVKEMNLVTRASLGQTLLKDLPVLLPPHSEQRAIATFLDNKCSQIDSLIALKQTKIDELKSFKKSLIYEYVTGKKTVPETV